MKIFRFLRSEHTLYIGVLLCITVIMHMLWFNPSSTITSSDWGHYQNSVIKELHHTAGTWMSYDEFGSVNIQLPFYIFMSAWSLLGNLGLSYDAASKITFFIPIAILGFTAPYILFFKLFKNKMAAFVAAVFYGTTTYGIANQPPIHFVYALTPLILYTFINAIEKNKFKHWLYFVLLYSLGIIYEVRIMYIVTFLLFLYAILFLRKNIFSTISRGAGAVPIILLLNLFWLLPTVTGAAIESIGAVANRGLFGSHLFDIQHALTLSNWYWTGAVPNDAFVKQAIPFQLWVFPILILLFLATNKERENRRTIIYFLIVAVAGVLLTKQVDMPFVGLYPWLYAHFPGFNLFREASKFFIVSSFGYAGLICALFCYYEKKFKSRRILLIAFTVLLLGVSLYNARPLITGELGGLFVNRHEPQTYKTLNKYLSEQKGFGRTYSLPTKSRWLYYSQNLPKVSAIVFAQNIASHFRDNNNESTPQVVEPEIMAPLTASYGRQLFNEAGIRYLVLPPRDTANDDDFYKFYGNDRNFYSQQLAQIPWLSKSHVNTGDAELYNNTTASPYITATTNLDEIDNLADMDSNYTFKSTALNDQHLQIVAKPPITAQKMTAPVRKISDIGGNITLPNIKTHKLNLNQDLTGDLSTILYTSNNPTRYKYRVMNNILSITPQYDDMLAVNGALAGADKMLDTQIDIASDTKTQYYIAQGKELYNIDKNSVAERAIKATNDDAHVYSSQSYSNLIANGEFESGKWHTNVEDCNPYNNDPRIGMKIVEHSSTSGTKALELSTGSHTACTTSNRFQVTAGAVYALHYVFRVIGGQRGGYDIVFNDKLRTTYHSDQIKSGNQWYALDTSFTAPVGATSAVLRLRGYQDEQGKVVSKTQYDDITLRPLIKISDITEPVPVKYNVRKLSENTLVSTYVDSTYTFKNLITNPSLEKGLWSQKVGDCNSYDKNAKLKMTINNSSKTDGKNSLQLEAARHVACTGPPETPVEESQTYLFNFDYQSPNTTEAAYYIQFNDPANTKYNEHLNISSTDWHHFSKKITAPYGATMMTVAVYSYADYYSSQMQINRYDNFSLIKIPDLAGRYYAVGTANTKLTLPKNVSYVIDNPTHKSIVVTEASTPFFLNMSEAYNSKWRLELNEPQQNGFKSTLRNTKQGAVSDIDHFNLDGFLNSWYVDPAKLCAAGSTACKHNADGSYDLKLVAEFTPQRYFYVGLIISGTTLAACMGYLGYMTVTKRRNKNALTSEEFISRTGDNSNVLRNRIVSWKRPRR
jgi:hypothetical protein